jgi:biotin operon repressor
MTDQARTPRPLTGDIFRLAPALTSDELLVLLALADYGARIFPSQAQLALKTRLHRSTVNRAVQSLREKGIVTAKGHGKALTYSLQLSLPATPTCRSQRQVLSPAATGAVAPSDRDPNYQTNYPNQPSAATAAAGVESPWDGIDPEDQRRIRRWVPRGVEELIAAQRRVTLRKLAEIGVRVSDHGRWWSHLGSRWAQKGMPPYDQLLVELEAMGPDVRDRLAMLAFRVGLGRVAA